VLHSRDVISSADVVPDAASARPDVEGERLREAVADRFRVHELIGTGMFSSVYRATDLSSAVDVALKVLSVDLRSVPALMQRLERSREATAAIRETGVVNAISIEQRDALSIVVIPLMTRGSLAKLMSARGPLPLEDVQRIVKEVAATLDRIHAHGLIHRGLSPSNILFDSAGHACITDLGVTDDLLRECGMHGSSAARARTFAAPEQWRDQLVDARVDQYALAKIAYQMLTGGHREIEEVVEGVHTLSPIEILAEVPLRKDIPLHVNAALRRALSANAANRFATATDFAEAFAGRAQAARGALPTAYPSIYEFRGRHPVLVTLGVLASIVIILVAIDPAAKVMARRAKRAVFAFLPGTNRQLHLSLDPGLPVAPAPSSHSLPSGPQSNSAGGSVAPATPAGHPSGQASTPATDHAFPATSTSAGSSPVTVKVRSPFPIGSASSTNNAVGAQGSSAGNAIRNATAWLKREFSRASSRNGASPSAYIQVSVDRGTAIVTVDGLPRGAAPATVTVVAGHHTISALGPLTYGAVQGVSASSGDTTRVVLRADSPP
jgi:eukaryotic-like serine/threonine-protein kinase